MRFPSNKFKIKKDNYVKFRDGNSKFLYITCAECDEPIMIYQKDGKGNLIRCYLDRIVWPDDIIGSNQLICSNCKNEIASLVIYAPEKRPAYRLIPGTLHIYRSLEQADARS